MCVQRGGYGVQRTIRLRRPVDCAVDVAGGGDRFAALEAAFVDSRPLVTCGELRVGPDGSPLLDSLVEELVVPIVLVGAQHGETPPELVVVEAVSGEDFALEGGGCGYLEEGVAVG